MGKAGGDISDEGADALQIVLDPARAGIVTAHQLAGLLQVRLRMAICMRVGNMHIRIRAAHGEMHSCVRA